MKQEKKPQSKTGDKDKKRKGIFSRWIDRLDRQLKDKADEKARQSPCCGGYDKHQGGGCC